MSDTPKTNEPRTAKDLQECSMVVNNRFEIYALFDQFIKIIFIDKKQISWEKSETSLVASEKDFSELINDNVLKELQENQSEQFSKSIKFKTSELMEKIKNENAIALLDHLNYLWTLGSSTSPTQLFKQKENNLSIFPQNGLWSTEGTAARYKFINDFVFLVNLFKNLKLDSSDGLLELRNKIEEFCLNEENVQGTPVIRNALVHLCNPSEHSPILSTTMKLSLLTNFDKTGKSLKEIDAAVKEICEKCKKYVDNQNSGFVFYNSILSSFLGRDDGASDSSMLQYKKAIILYGPPGTSKTYSANQIAKSVLVKFCENLKDKSKYNSVLETIQQKYSSIEKGDKIKKLPEKKESDLTNETRTDIFEFISNYNIHRLQLHPNYSYEDFVWGYEITRDTESNTSISKAKKGYLLKLLKEIKGDIAPHILILDEINRVDLSRLFGELFSAIENRGEKNKIELPVKFDDGDNCVWIPDNLYIIGTMNEIDFSLERVDFALRRRFAWIFKGYNEGVLEQIMQRKAKEIEKERVVLNFAENFDNELKSSDYIKNCTELNSMIENDTDLGPQYQIGHTIFAEIVSIYAEMSASTLKEAQQILWNISIKPLLEAYLGNMEEKALKDKVAKFKDRFELKN